MQQKMRKGSYKYGLRQSQRTSWKWVLTVCVLCTYLMMTPSYLPILIFPQLERPFFFFFFFLFIFISQFKPPPLWIKANEGRGREGRKKEGRKEGKVSLLTSELYYAESCSATAHCVCTLIKQSGKESRLKRQTSGVQLSALTLIGL